MDSFADVDVCRVCLVKRDILHSIWDSCGDKTIADLMGKVLEIEIHPYDLLSKSICCACVKVLEDSNALRKVAKYNEAMQMKTSETIDKGSHEASETEFYEFPASQPIAVPQAHLVRNHKELYPLDRQPFKQTQEGYHHASSTPKNKDFTVWKPKENGQVQATAHQNGYDQRDKQQASWEEEGDDRELRLRQCSSVDSLDLPRYSSIKSSVYASVESSRTVIIENSNSYEDYRYSDESLEMSQLQGLDMEEHDEESEQGNQGTNLDYCSDLYFISIGSSKAVSMGSSD